MESLPLEQQVLAVTGLRKYFDFLIDVENEELDYTDSKALLKKALERLDLRIEKSLMEEIKSNDFIEIYTSDYVPLFKSLNFWGNSSYPLDVLYSNHYQELFARDEFYQAAIRRSAEKIFKGVEKVIYNPVPEHVAWEVRGPLKSLIKYKFFAGVYDNDDSLIGTIVVCDIKPLSN